ncbi:MAG: adenylate/guanylate cyclase domain-containing protein [Ginsengibacter sp.]
MEENIAILMADLSGYTALTETHGANSAADLIDKYTSIAERCLVGDSKLHERVGDEMVIVSASADCLLATALKIGRHASKEENFLQLHGGLHYGKVLKRGNSYFGSAINITSRIAAKAKAGTFWCSGDYVNALTDKSSVSLTSKGNQRFKNVDKENEVFEVDIQTNIEFHIDPVCRMIILDPKRASPHPHEGGLYFCSLDCLEKYAANH